MTEAEVKSAQEVIEKLDTMVVDAKNDNTDDMSTISYQSGRSLKDKITIVQNNEEAQNIVTQLRESLKEMTESINLAEIQNAVDDKIKEIQTSSKSTWRDIEKNTHDTFESVGTKSKASLQNMGESSKLLMDQTVAVVKSLPENGVKASIKARDSVVENSIKVSTKVKESAVNCTEATMIKIECGTSKVKDLTAELCQKILEFHNTNSKYYIGKAPGVFEYFDASTKLEYAAAQVCLLSVGMILNCENPVTGLIIWCAILCASPLVAISGLFSLLSAMAFQNYALPSSSSTTDLAWNIRAGANVFLVGAMISAMVDFSSNISVEVLSKLILAICLGPNCLLVHWQLFPSSKKSFLWSYNITFGVFILAFSLWDVTWLKALAPHPDSTEMMHFSPISSTLSSVSAIFGVSNPWCGFFILFGVFLCSRILSAFLVITCAIASLLGWAFGMPLAHVNAGVAGYEAGLTALACAYYFIPSKKLPIFTIVAVTWTCVLETAIAGVFHSLIGSPITLTIAFCLVMYPLVENKDITKFGLELISDSDLSFPEEHLVCPQEDEKDKNVILIDANDEEDQNEKEVEPDTSTVVTEVTPLISKSLDV